MSSDDLRKIGGPMHRVPQFAQKQQPFHPVTWVKEAAKRFDAGDNEKEIVLTRQGEDSVDEIIPDTALAQVNFEPLAKKAHELGEKCIGATSEYAPVHELVLCQGLSEK